MSLTAVRLGAPDDLADADAALDGAPAEEVVAWARERFGDGLVLASSLSDCVLLDLAARVVPGLAVVFLDTQYHFPETLAYLETIRARFPVQLEVVRPLVAPDERWRTDTDACCAARKVEPLRRALSGRSAWMTGLRRSESLSRRRAPVVSWDAGRGLVKVNPLAAWSGEDVAVYVALHDLPRHPLEASGYRSVGCWPCTRPTAEGEDPRAGRWSGSAKSECGIHL